MEEVSVTSKRTSWLVLLVVFALIAAACSSGGGTTTTAAGGGEGTTTTTAGGGGGATTTTAPPGGGEEMKADFGVDVESKTINIGMLVDLTGIFSPLTTDIADAQIAYWDDVNANGGIDGWTVNLVIEDTNYNVDQHIEKYEKIRNDVVALGHSTGSPTNVATLPKYKEDGMLFLPISWYSGWGIPEFDGGLALEQYTNYCIEAMDILGFINEMGGTKVALATFPGDYGQDAAAGVKKAVEFYGMELVYDGEAAVIPGQDQTPVITGIAQSGADWVFLTTNPSTAAELMGGAAQAGFQGMWTGSVPSYDFRLLDSPVAPLIDQVYYQPGYNVVWGEDVPGAAKMQEVLTAAFPDRRPSDAFVIGWVYSISLHEVLKTAIANGDLTRAGVVAAANSLTGIDFGGLAPNQSYAGTPNEYVQRAIAMFKPSLEKYTAAGGADQVLSGEGTTTGSELVKDFFVSDAAKDFEYTEPCYQL